MTEAWEIIDDDGTSRATTDAAYQHGALAGIWFGHLHSELANGIDLNVYPSLRRLSIMKAIDKQNAEFSTYSEASNYVETATWGTVDHCELLRARLALYEGITEASGGLITEAVPGLAFAIE